MHVYITPACCSLEQITRVLTFLRQNIIKYPKLPQFYSLHHMCYCYMEGMKVNFLDTKDQKKLQEVGQRNTLCMEYTTYSVCPSIILPSIAECSPFRSTANQSSIRVYWLGRTKSSIFSNIPPPTTSSGSKEASWKCVCLRGPL